MPLIQARIIAESIVGHPRNFRGVQGTAICGIFNNVAASTGLNEKQLKRMGKEYFAIYIHNGHHVEYYPGKNMSIIGAKPVHIKLLYNSEGEILGAQAVGTEGVDKRIDGKSLTILVISTMIQMGGKVQNLMEAELCYSPQFGSGMNKI